MFNRLLSVIIWICLWALPLRAESSNQSPIKIGAIFILSGEGAATGTASKNGLELAARDLNAQGGVLGRKLELSYQDDQSDPKKTISAFHDLVDAKGIKLIIGPTWSNLGLAVMDLAIRSKVLMISPSLGMAKFNESSEYLFNTWPHDYILSEKLADLVYKDGHKNIALIGAEHIWVKEQTAAFKNRFESLGGKIAYLTEPLPGTADLRAEALKIKNMAGVDAFVSTSDGVVVGSLVAKSLKELGVRIPLYSITLDQGAIDAAGGGFDGLKFLTFLTPKASFKSRYEAEFKVPMDIGADSAYDALMLLAQAIKAANSVDSTAVAQKLSQVKSYLGESGHLISDGKRGFVKELALMMIKDGRPYPAPTVN